jgi:hypothetical protein
MPTVISRGAGSARGFGFGSGGAGTTLQTVTFTSNGTWTAPAGVSLVTTASGYGGETVPGAWSGTPVNGGFVAYSYENDNFPGSPSNTPTYAEVTSTANATLASINSSTGDRTISFTVIVYDYNPNTNGTSVSYGSSSYRARGAATSDGGASTWGNTSSNLVQGLGAGWYFNIERYYEGYTTTGASSTAIGRTFPGGDGGPAGTTTYTNVSVTPGTSYSIVVPSGGSVTLQYYA